MSPIKSYHPARPMWRAPQPLRHTRYPWDSPKEESVTIAAGFRVANGILIGADTRIEEGNVKYEQNKVFDCHESGTNCAVLLAGAGNFESISYCADLLRTHGFLGSTDHLDTLKERVLKFLETKRYRRLIERQAPYGDFSAIVALRSGDGETDLLSLSGECLYPIPEYRCIGAGSETALFISKWLYKPDYPIHVFVPMAIQVFRAAKGHNTGCDDSTRIVRLYNAESGLEPKRTVWGDTDYLWGVHDLLGSVIQGCFDLRAATEEFQASLRGLDEKVVAIREANEQSAQFTSGVKELLESPNRDLQSPPASPELP